MVMMITFYNLHVQKPESIKFCILHEKTSRLEKKEVTRTFYHSVKDEDIKDIKQVSIKQKQQLLKKHILDINCITYILNLLIS